jgi:hypothetical protein
MANIIRSAKCGSDWTSNDLTAYNITILPQNASTFFGQPDLPVPAVNPQLLNGFSAADMTDESCFHVAKYIDFVMDPVQREESAVDDFVMELLKVTGYRGRTRFLHSRKNIPFFICGMRSHSKTDVCVVDDNFEIILLVHGDKSLGDPRPSLIAQAIAAVQTNNTRRETVLNLPPLQYKMMAGIIMTGTYPIFFKIPITSQLIEAVQLGQHPSTPTIVMMHLPDILRPAHRLSQGMRPLDNRCTILACFEAFKQFVIW